ncbi:MAG: hypothetical protein QXI11_09460 [Thermoproteota archaeon]
MPAGFSARTVVVVDSSALIAFFLREEGWRSMASYLGRLMKCKECGLIMDRDVVAVLSLQMRGEGFPSKCPQ